MQNWFFYFNTTVYFPLSVQKSLIQERAGITFNVITPSEKIAKRDRKWKKTSRFKLLFQMGNISLWHFKVWIKYHDQNQAFPSLLATLSLHTALSELQYNFSGLTSNLAMRLSPQQEEFWPQKQTANSTSKTGQRCQCCSQMRSCPWLFSSLYGELMSFTPGSYEPAV